MPEHFILPADQLIPGLTIAFKPMEPNLTFLHGPSGRRPVLVEGPVLRVNQYELFPGETCLTLPQGNYWFDNGHTLVVTGDIEREELVSQIKDTFQTNTF